MNKRLISLISAHLLFYGCLKGACSAQDIGLVLQQSSLAPEQLLVSCISSILLEQ